jgi:hypothetical protein
VILYVVPETNDPAVAVVGVNTTPTVFDAAPIKVKSVVPTDVIV